MAAISHVFTLSTSPNSSARTKNGSGTFRSIWNPKTAASGSHGVGEDGVPAFTAYGIECLEQIIADERAAGRAPPKIEFNKLRSCGVRRISTAYIRAKPSRNANSCGR